MDCIRMPTQTTGHADWAVINKCGVYGVLTSVRDSGDTGYPELA